MCAFLNTFGFQFIALVTFHVVTKPAVITMHCNNLHANHQAPHLPTSEGNYLP